MLSALGKFARLFPLKCISFLCEIENWSVYLTISMLLNMIYIIYILVRFPLNWLYQTRLWRLLSWWPRFYRSIIFPKQDKLRPKRSIWKIITQPTPEYGPKPGGNGIVCLNSNYYCHSFYQTQGAYAHLNQPGDTELNDAISASQAVLFYDDPLLLSVPYDFLMKRLPEPPDGIIKTSLCLGAIIIAFMYPILRGFGPFWFRLILSPFRNYARRRSYRRCRSSRKPLPTLTIRCHTTDLQSSDDQQGADFDLLSWDTDAIPFVIDNSATGIICNVRKLFVGQLKPYKVSIETAHGTQSKVKLVGTMRLVLTDDANEHHSYDIPDCVFDPDSPINIIGVPTLGAFFGRHDDIPNEDDDGTWVRSSANKSILTWDHGKHTRQFRHPSSKLPELHLYRGRSYFQAFCAHTRLRK